MAAHVFRFFVDAAPSDGDVVELRSTDCAHVDVLRMTDGAGIDVVGTDGVVRSARLRRGDARARAAGTTWLAVCGDEVRDARGGADDVRITVAAGVLTGARFDELVGAAVQVGACEIVPVAATRAEADRIDARRARLERIATTAAKQAKHVHIATISPARSLRDLVDDQCGDDEVRVVLDADAQSDLVSVVGAAFDGGDSSAARGGLRRVVLFVGPPGGIDPVDVASLVDAGWSAARLTHGVLRSELAAPVAVAVASIAIRRNR